MRVSNLFKPGISAQVSSIYKFPYFSRVPFQDPSAASPFLRFPLFLLVPICCSPKSYLRLVLTGILKTVYTTSTVLRSDYNYYTEKRYLSITGSLKLSITC